ncbi:hypothetical protein DV096_20220 [Bradymonadaceae bacterium TMQ3]|nr:hypothetical protein DV096_20220 [Bradymonadaceae bacterium TMQ3]
MRIRGMRGMRELRGMRRMMILKTIRSASRASAAPTHAGWSITAVASRWIVGSAMRRASRR